MTITSNLDRLVISFTAVFHIVFLALKPSEAKSCEAGEGGLKGGGNPEVNTLYCDLFDPVTKRDFLSLREGVYVNDVIINFYLKYLFASLEASNKKKTHIFSSFFYQNLTDTEKSKVLSKPSDSLRKKRHTTVKRWTKNMNIFEKDFIVIPVNVKNLHWYLAIICFPGLLAPKREGVVLKAPVILFLDSLEDGRKEEVASILREYLASEWEERMENRRESNARTFHVTSSRSCFHFRS